MCGMSPPPAPQPCVLSEFLAGKNQLLRLPQSWCCSFPMIRHPLSAWLGSPAFPPHRLLWAWSQRPPVSSVGSTEEEYHRLSRSDQSLPCEPEVRVSPLWSPRCRCHSLQDEASTKSAGSLIKACSLAVPARWRCSCLSPTKQSCLVLHIPVSTSPTNLPISAQGSLDTL